LTGFGESASFGRGSGSALYEIDGSLRNEKGRTVVETMSGHKLEKLL
jgi:hypothetical protein